MSYEADDGTTFGLDSVESHEDLDVSVTIRQIRAFADEGTEGSRAISYNGEVWLQFYGTRQEISGKITGSGNGWGASGGVDFMLDPNTVVGMGLIYSDNDSTAKTANSTSTVDTNSWGVTAYAGRQEDSGMRYSGVLSFLWNDHELSRRVLTNQMTASYGSTTFGARGDFSHDFDFGEFLVTPQAALVYTRNSVNGYKEAGPLAQSVGATTLTSLIGQAGVSVSSSGTLGDNLVIMPSIHANVLYEFNDRLGSYSGALVSKNGADPVVIGRAINALDRTRYNVGTSIKNDPG